MQTTPTTTLDRATLLEWLDLDADGALPAGEKSRLDAAIAADPALGAVGRESAALLGLLHADRVPVRNGFREATMAALPEASWEGASSRVAFALPLALAALFTLGAAVMLGATGAFQGADPLVGTGLAVFDFLRSALLAGAGLLGATWTGVGLGLEELFQTSGVSLVGFGVAVLMVDLLLVALLRRRPARQGAAADAGTPDVRRQDD